VAAAVVNVAADLVYVFWFGWGIPGLALGHATSYLFATLACGLILRRRLHGLDGRRILATVARVVPAALIGAGGAALATSAIRAGFGADLRFGVQLLEVAGGVVAGVLAFLVTALMLRIREVDDVKDAVLRRVRA
jgi:putative peptidoglycan lipid II flippase